MSLPVGLLIIKHETYLTRISASIMALVHATGFVNSAQKRSTHGPKGV